MSVPPERKERFKYSKSGLPNFPSPSLDPKEFIEELKRIPKEERMAMVRTWVQDRSPAAFAAVPYLWEAVREWIARRHTLSPRQIGLAGSAQIGFSTSPSKNLSGFNKNGSDLDIYIVSEQLFEKLEKEASLFIVRQFSAEKSDFIDQANTTKTTLGRGYVDIQNIPAKHDIYPVCSKLRNDASIIIDKLKLEGYHLKPSHFRVYKDWSAKAEWTRIQADSWAKKC
jgi:hypothetical protein